jgi:hypothetical protein
MTRRRRQRTHDQHEEHRPLQVSQADATEYFRPTAKTKTKTETIVFVAFIVSVRGLWERHQLGVVEVGLLTE